jgi:hypothetical protein
MLFDFRAPGSGAGAGQGKPAAPPRRSSQNNEDEEDLQLDEDLGHQHSQAPVWNLMPASQRAGRKRAFEWDEDEENIKPLAGPNSRYAHAQGISDKKQSHFLRANMHVHGALPGKSTPLPDAHKAERTFIRERRLSQEPRKGRDMVGPSQHGYEPPPPPEDGRASSQNLSHSMHTMKKPAIQPSQAAFPRQHYDFGDHLEQTTSSQGARPLRQVPESPRAHALPCDDDDFEACVKTTRRPSQGGPSSQRAVPERNMAPQHDLDDDFVFRKPEPPSRPPAQRAFEHPGFHTQQHDTSVPKLLFPPQIISRFPHHVSSPSMQFVTMECLSTKQECWDGRAQWQWPAETPTCSRTSRNFIPCFIPCRRH